MLSGTGGLIIRHVYYLDDDRHLQDSSDVGTLCYAIGESLVPIMLESIEQNETFATAC